MPRNPYIRDNANEQNLIEELTVEVIRAMGRDVYYIPRTLNAQDALYGEDTLSTFEDAYLLEMYHENSTSFGGEGDIVSKFGIDVRDTAAFRVARKTFEQFVTKKTGSLVRPREGDLIYYPLSDTLFEITFVEHENPLYQVGALYSFVIFVETFVYNNETFSTGLKEIDTCFEKERKKLAQLFTFGNIVGNNSIEFIDGEQIYQVSGTFGTDISIQNATGIADILNISGNTLTIAPISGSFLTGTESIVGESSGAERFLSATGDADFNVQINTVDQSAMGDNEEIDLEVSEDNLIDFSETDPFSEGKF